MRGISAIVPLYNEEDNVILSYQEITSVLEALENGVVAPGASLDGPVSPSGATPRMAGMPYEIIFVDDGSKDRSVERLMGVAAGDPHVRIVQFRRNFGQTAAMAAGFDYVALGRALLAEPDLIDRIKADGSVRSICDHCNKCMPTIYTKTHCVVTGAPG